MLHKHAANVFFKSHVYNSCLHWERGEQKSSCNICWQLCREAVKDLASNIKMKSPEF